jgi:broad specificity phosphatase PhoE
VLHGIKIPLKKFYMARHGETIANLEGYAAGSMDTPLTEKGREQAAALRHILSAASVVPKIIVHSHLSRARETAAILNESLKLPMLEQRDVAEWSFGDWAGQPWPLVQDRVRNGETPPNGESAGAFFRRAMKGLSEILRTHDQALVVTHGGVFDAFAAAYGCELASVENCHLYEFSPAQQAPQFPWNVWRHYLIDHEKAGKMSVNVAFRADSRVSVHTQ